MPDTTSNNALKKPTATETVTGSRSMYNDNADVLDEAILGKGGGKVKYQNHGNAGATETIDLANGNVHRVVLDQTPLVLTFPAAVSGRQYGFRLIVVQDATGSRLITWPASVKWPAGTAPTLSTGANKIDVTDFFTVDGGTTWLGEVVGLDFR